MKFYRRKSDSQEITGEGNRYLPLFLILIGIVVCSLVVIESFLQASGSAFSYLNVAHSYGFLLNYDVSTEPNKGIWHPIGWIGSGCFVLMMLYSVRKHLAFMRNMGPLRFWLDVHMFLGIVGAVFITTHTTYKFGGIVSLSYFSMALVALSGFVGRYIYIHVPHSISGNELAIDEVESLLERINAKIIAYAGRDSDITSYFERIDAPPSTEDMSAIHAVTMMVTVDLTNLGRLRSIRRDIWNNPDLSNNARQELYKLIKRKGDLLRSINFLSISQRLLHYWHVFHKPFAFIMFVVMFLHIAVFFLFRIKV